MSVQKYFWQDPYCTSLTATVVSAEGDVITLDQTIYFAFSGGQASDAGTIGGLPVLEARKDGQEILYTLPNGHGLHCGDPVKVTIDWEKRYRLMRLHFAAEIILELVYQNYNHPKKIGANITDEKARVDFEWQGNIGEVLPVIAEQAKKLIYADLPIRSDFSDEAKELRYWEIAGFAKVACGGTHIRRTGEVGELILKRGKRLGSNKERIEIYLA